MIHLITFIGKSARNFYLNQQCISDFKSVMRTITSGRVMLISTKFRSDLFYISEKDKNNSILKLWAFYTNTDLSNLIRKDLSTSTGDEESLSKYFEGMNILATNRYYYRLYKKAFDDTFSSDYQNPIASTLAQCDQYLIGHPNIKRTALMSSYEKADFELTNDTLSMAMRIMNNQTLSN